VDVRDEEQYRAKHVAGAVNMPLDQLEERIAELGALDTKIVVYCNKGVSSARAKDLLIEAGYRDVKNGGGLDDMLEMERKK
jgi:phage shock protein E